VLDAASSVAIVMLHVMGRVAPPAGAVPEICYCPRCGKKLWVPYGEVLCRHCEDSYLVEPRPRTDLPPAFVTKEPQ
jgi:hypothetical protein